MKNNLKVSIITVCYNAFDYIEKTIESILIQTYGNIEYLIIDGGSNDGTLDIILKYNNKISKIISEKDSGIYDAMNKGLELATGDVVYFLNADDVLYDKDVIKDVVQKFKQNPNLLLLYGNVGYLFEANSVKDLRKFNKISSKTILHENLCHQAVFAKRVLFDEIGMFDLQYKIVADYDWLLKVFLQKKHSLLYFDRIIAKFNYGGYHTQNFQLHKKERMTVKLKYSNRFDYYLRNFIYRTKRKLSKIYEHTR